MDADRRERAKSIRAAREWLTGAEVALAGEDDLAGDLKLMLARAELARLAADRRARVRRWAGRLLPPVMVAAAILVWMMWMSPHGEEVATPLPMQTADPHCTTDGGGASIHRRKCRAGAQSGHCTVAYGNTGNDTGCDRTAPYAECRYAAAHAGRR